MNTNKKRKRATAKLMSDGQKLHSPVRMHEFHDSRISTQLDVYNEHSIDSTFKTWLSCQEVLSQEKSYATLRFVQPPTAALLDWNNSLLMITTRLMQYKKDGTGIQTLTAQPDERVNNRLNRLNIDFQAAKNKVGLGRVG